MRISKYIASFEQWVINSFRRIGCMLWVLKFAWSEFVAHRKSTEVLFNSLHGEHNKLANQVSELSKTLDSIITSPPDDAVQDSVSDDSNVDSYQQWVEQVNSALIAHQQWAGQINSALVAHSKAIEQLTGVVTQLQSLLIIPSGTVIH